VSGVILTVSKAPLPVAGAIADVPDVNTTNLAGPATVVPRPLCVSANDPPLVPGGYAKMIAPSLLVSMAFAESESHTD
jgi:hypothetical protein